VRRPRCVGHGGGPRIRSVIRRRAPNLQPKPAQAKMGICGSSTMHAPIAPMNSVPTESKKKEHSSLVAPPGASPPPRHKTVLSPERDL
jgi:hypothetical protein